MAETKSLDDISVTLDRIPVIKNKYFLRKIYEERYDFFKSHISTDPQAKIVEIGSGAGFIKEIIPHALTSEYMKLPNVDLHFSALDMPFEDKSVDAFLMIDVFHHIPDIERFFTEVSRCLKIGGKLIMTEPANTPWSRYIYQHFHHETFDPKGEWSFDSKGPLSDANGALPYIVFERDSQKFSRLFLNLKVTYLKKHSPFIYLTSGGFTTKQLLPNFAYPLVRFFEKLMTPFMSWLGMFETVIVESTQKP